MAASEEAEVAALDRVLTRTVLTKDEDLQQVCCRGLRNPAYSRQPRAECIHAVHTEAEARRLNLILYCKSGCWHQNELALVAGTRTIQPCVCGACCISNPMPPVQSICVFVCSSLSSCCQPWCRSWQRHSQRRGPRCDWVSKGGRAMT